MLVLVILIILFLFVVGLDFIVIIFLNLNVYLMMNVSPPNKFAKIIFVNLRKVFLVKIVRHVYLI